VNRREFITLIGGAAAAWPLAAHAQQPERMRRIGVLMYGNENDYDYKARLSGFMQSLAKSGWADSRNLLVDVRWTAANLDLVRRHAKELVALKPDVLVATSTPATAAFQDETPVVPIVFVGISDPLGAGFVANLAHPGGNSGPYDNKPPSLAKLATAATRGKWAC
jgi:putative ABC transport system substrate-binding protein